ncbi:flagellar basal-body MS-ring/collar protein FliF [Sediminicoccus sp. KRV36]|uniref:flagellar basal-body MS-ring/collar protein FliF n=1 Tax=Sediminicoccus sp. KRV36 TaxID=3133721 RepID=UPI00201073F2|nr:flagellar basal-body MS-ring/collar protein FliF [Sediminicoccus rosea]UPY37498.1 flagellar M-ring protein FliF [Sediminicoccus rosea]
MLQRAVPDGAMQDLIAQLRGLGRIQMLALAGTAIGVLGLIIFLVMRAGTPAMGLLYGELESRDAGAVVAALERQRVPYRLAAGGMQVLVPAEDVPRLRLSLAREGLPAGGSIGNELFDRNESLTTTPFQQEMNRLRAMEGELARSIRGLSGVRAARVHLVLPRREAFSRERAEAQASVLLTMQGAQRLDREGVQSVLHLVVTAVPGLRAQNVSIVDSRGELLARGGQALSGPAGAQTQEELRRGQEARLSRAVEEMLERVLGHGRVRAEVALDMDFDRVETREERFDPENQVARSTQSSNETSRTLDSAAVGVANNLPGAEAASGGGGNQESRQEETSNFEIGRTIRNVLREHPVTRRLTVAVLVDGVTETRPDGSATRRERTPEELARIAALVRNAVGFSEPRGDRVEVVSMPFAEPGDGSRETGPLGLDIPPAVLARLLETAVIGLLILLTLLLVARPVARKLSLSLNPTPALAGMGGAALEGGGDQAAIPGQPGDPSLPGGERPAGLLAGQDGADDEAMVHLAHVQGQLRASYISRITSLVDSHPEEALAAVRRWLAPEEEA